MPLLADDLQLLVLARVAEARPQEEAVELRLGQRERALVLDRVLGRDQQERVGQRAASTPSTVTWCSAIASSSADCVFGIARLISSTSTMFANSGPSLELERPVLLVEDGEAGRRRSAAGRACTGSATKTTPSMLPAIARARTVFAVPGTSSKQDVAAADERSEHEPDLLALPVHDRLDVGEQTAGDLIRRLASAAQSDASGPVTSCELSSSPTRRPRTGAGSTGRPAAAVH